jgi:hypothetical protein
MQSAASTIEHDDERRRLLEEAQDMRRLAVEVAKVEQSKGKIFFFFDSLSQGDPKVAKAAKKVVLDLSTVASVMRTDDLSAQVSRVRCFSLFFSSWLLGCCNESSNVGSDRSDEWNS